MDRVITPDVISVADFFGPRAVNINHINAKFPLLRIVVRGGSIYLSGAQKQMDIYQRQVEVLVDYFVRYGHLSPEIVDSLIDESPLKSKSDNLDQLATREQNVDLIVYGNNGVAVKACTASQRALVKCFAKNDMIFAVGPAGSGKTYTAIALAVRALKNREVKKIILTRPAVEAGEKLGFLPGDLKEKLDPYLQPLYDALGDMMPRSKLNEYMVEGVVQIAPLAYMRGRTLDNAIVILDEAQNTSPEQLKMFLTRMGRRAKFLITGDLTQIDLPLSQSSGLVFALERLGHIEGIARVEFTSSDIMRHKLVRSIVEAYEEIDNQHNKSTKK